MKKLVLAAAIALVCACGSAPVADIPASSQATVRIEKEEVISTGTPMATADLSIGGMTCAMGCGHTIKNAIATLQGVENTEVAFENAEVDNHVIVTFDPAKVSDAQLVKAVQDIKNGLYTVKQVEVTKQVLSSGASPAAEGEAEDEVNASMQELSLPNIFDLLSGLLRI